MSHLIEEYAKNLGVKANKTPVIMEHFWPLPFEKYIVINSGAETPSKTYRYFGLMLDMLMPVLEKQGIHVIQIGSSQDRRLENVSLRLVDISARQAAYVVSHSMLYVGSDCVWSHYANSKNIPIVTIHGNAYAGISNGYWNDNQVNIEGVWEKCPVLAAQDPNNSVNKIKPEDIAHACCKLLGISYNNSLKTINIGKLFGEPIVEIVPDMPPNFEPQQSHAYFIRADYAANDQFLGYWCQHLPRFSVFLSKKTNLNIVAQFHNKINSLMIDVDGDDSEEIKQFVAYASKITKNLVLLGDVETIASTRNKWFDYKVFPKNSQAKDERFNRDGLWLASSKMVIDQFGQYPSLYHREHKDQNCDTLIPMPKNEAFLEEIEHFAVFEKAQKSS